MQKYGVKETIHARQCSWDKNNFQGGEFDAGASYALHRNIGYLGHQRDHGASHDINWSILQPIMAFESTKSYSFVRCID